MNKFKIPAIVLVLLTAIVTVLLYNKSRMESNSRNDVQKAIPVATVMVAKMKLTESRSLVGTIVPNNDVVIVSETEGKVVAVSSKVGDYKAAGSVLFQIDDELKKAAFATAEVNYEKAKRDFERFESLHGEHAVTDQQFEGTRLAFKAAEAQYIAARKQYNDTKITTPISGIVTARLVDIGTMVQLKMPVANVVDIVRLKVKLNVAERDAFLLKAGDRAEIGTDVYPGVTFGGKIESISSKSDEAHTYPLEITLLNSKDHPLKAGMFARVSFRALSHDEILAIPRAALVGSVKKPQVFTVENEMARLRDIVVRNEIGTNLEVLSGLREGEMIVVSGQNNLKDGTQVVIVK